ncbi:PREDICTED: uncharacterized protein LOC106820048, partial [Priapulus caudatus]|uniref:Uncharacterized protein LOC106820048 n=1 Tax=Priapulus caudatus TaxID=37621 RepID=A0ABM1F6M1_PRICU
DTGQEVEAGGKRVWGVRGERLEEGGMGRRACASVKLSLASASGGQYCAAGRARGSAGFRVSNAARPGFHGGASGTTGALFRTMSVGQVPTTRLQQVRQIIGGPQRRVVPAVAQTGVFRTGFGDEFDINTFGTLRAGNFGVPTFAGPYVDIGQFDFAARKEAAFASAPGDSRVKEGALQQVPVGKRYKSGFAAFLLLILHSFEANKKRL